MISFRRRFGHRILIAVLYADITTPSPRYLWFLGCAIINKLNFHSKNLIIDEVNISTSRKVYAKYAQNIKIIYRKYVLCDK